MNSLKRLLLLLTLVCMPSVSVLAQNAKPEHPDKPAAAQAAEAPPAGSEEKPGTAQQAQPSMEQGGKLPSFNDEQYRSLVFTYWERATIKDTRNAFGTARGVTQEELDFALKNKKDAGQKVKPPPEARELRLGGIAYRSEKDWTLWLNENRITPDAMPKEIIDLKVYKTYIEMKWFDEWSNQIYPIRLRPHQRFNLDARIFLPG